MLFSKLTQYKLVEFDKGLILLDPSDGLKDRPGTNVLMIGSAGHVISYLDRYLWERENGLEMREAHELALGSAGVTTILPGQPKAGT